MGFEKQSRGEEGDEWIGIQHWVVRLRQLACLERFSWVYDL